MAAKKGDNSIKQAEDKKKALFFHHLKKRMNHNAEISAIRTEKKDDGKLAQMDGIKLENMDFAIKTMEKDDKSIPRAKYIAQGEILAWLGYITEFNPSEVLADRAPAGERWQAEGELAGGLGIDRQSPYGPGSTEEQDWLIGYDRGRAIYLDNIADALDDMDKKRAKEAAATKKKATKGGEPLEGDLPPEATKQPEKPTAEVVQFTSKANGKAKPKGKGKQPAKPDAGKTNAEAERQRQGEAAFE